MLEEANNPARQAISRPNQHALDLLRLVIADNPQPVIAEIGVGIGATSLELCRVLQHQGMIYFFDFADKLTALDADLRREGFTNFRMVGNERKTFASYAWELAKFLLERRKQSCVRLFDFVFLDGAHYLHHDAPAAVILKDLLKPGGYILFDDYDWSIAISPTVNPSKNPRILHDFSQEQITTPHVRLVCELFFDPDLGFRKVEIGYGEHEHRRAYRKAVDDGTR